MTGVQTCALPICVGSIEAGKDADFVLTGENPFAVDTHILYTMIDGNVVYEGEKA